MLKLAALALVAGAFASPAWAEVKTSTPDSFTLEYAIEVEGVVKDAYQGVAAIDQWWNAAHTYSGDSVNLYLDFEGGGCFCEYLDDGGEVEHGRVILAWPERMVRFDAALGPLQEMAVNGVLTFAWSPAPGEGEGLTLSLTYVVNGPGVGALASAVDGVMQDQFARWAGFVAQDG